MRGSTRLIVTSAVLAAGLGLSACGVSSTASTGASSSSGPVKGLRILVPNSPGSGYDTTARAAAKAMQDAKLAETSRSSTRPVPVARSGCSAWSTRRAPTTS